MGTFGSEGLAGVVTVASAPHCIWFPPTSLTSGPAILTRHAPWSTLMACVVFPVCPVYIHCVLTLRPLCLFSLFLPSRIVCVVHSLSSAPTEMSLLGHCPRYNSTPSPRDFLISISYFSPQHFSTFDMFTSLLVCLSSSHWHERPRRQGLCFVILIPSSF